MEQWQHSLDESLFFPKEHGTLVKMMQQQDASALKKCMKLSDNLATLNVQRYQNWANAPKKAAIFAFCGDVYRGIDVKSLPLHSLKQMEKKLRILSGIYGLLRPMNAIKPHRLEMGTAVKNPLGDHLYAFWGDKIANELKKELQQKEFLVHLASKEYFQSVEKGLKKSGIFIVTPIFLDRTKNGTFATVGIHAKKARGLMTRYIITENCQTLDEIKQFNTEDYVFFQQKENNGECQLIFRRG